MDVGAATKETEDWRAMHEESYRRNWATIAGLHFLEPGSHTAGSARGNDIVLPASASSPRVGRFVLSGDVVRFEPDAAARVHIGDRAIMQPIDLVDDEADMPDELEVGGIRVMVHRSGQRKSLRVWDPQGEMARGFLGFRWFPITPALPSIQKPVSGERGLATSSSLPGCFFWGWSPPWPHNPRIHQRWL